MAKGLYEKWLEKENLTLLAGWRRDGLTLTQIAKNIGVTRKTLDKWKNEHVPIGDALKKGNDICCYEVENALYKSAIGYDVTETEQTETIYPDGTKTVVKRARKRHIPPNVGSICFILKNRAPEKWRDRPIVEDNRALETLQQILEETRKAAEEDETNDGTEVQQETEGISEESNTPV